MSDSVDKIDSWSKSEMANFVSTKNTRKISLKSFASKSLACLPIKPITAVKDWKVGKMTGGEAASFLIKILVLEAMRRFSKAKCPFVWTGLQTLQVFCYPPFKWIQRWKPFKFVAKGMQVLSRPLLVLSIVNALSDLPDRSNMVSDDSDNTCLEGDSESSSSEPHSRAHSFQGPGNEDHQSVQPSSWMNPLSEELDKWGMTLPDRITYGELQRFYIAANGDLPNFLSSVKKTIRWRETYRILSVEELEIWTSMIFWHGLDVNDRPCLIIRLGMACSLPAKDRPSFVQAVVSQVEYGVLHLVDGENPQITVILDCFGLSPLRFPMQMMRFCSNLLQDNYPSVLGCLFIIRLPPVVRVIAQTFIKVLKPVTKQKLRIEGEAYKKVLLECFQALPAYLGGQCTCRRCSKLDTGRTRETSDKRVTSTESDTDSVSAEDLLEEQPAHEDDMIVDGYCSRALRSAVIGILIFWVLLAFLEGIYNLETEPELPR